MFVHLAVLVGVFGSVCLVISARRTGWRLLCLACVLAVMAPIAEHHMDQLVHGLAPIADTVLSIGLIALLLYLVGARRSRPSAHKDRVDRS